MIYTFYVFNLFDLQVAEGEQAVEAAPPAARGGGWAMFKTLLIRMVVIYMISSWLRRPSTPATQPGEGPSQPGAPGQAIPSTNIYPKDTVMVSLLFLASFDYILKGEGSNELCVKSTLNDIDYLFFLKIILKVSPLS